MTSNPPSNMLTDTFAAIGKRRDGTFWVDTYKTTDKDGNYLLFAAGNQLELTGKKILGRQHLESAYIGFIWS